MPRRIAWLNEKGGSGKSTGALNVSAILASQFAKSVLLVDVDHQANITAVLTKGEPGRKTLTHVFLEDLPAQEANRFATASQVQRRFPDHLTTERTAQYQLANLTELGHLGTTPVQSTSPNFPFVYHATGRGLRLRASAHSGQNGLAR